MPIYTSGDKRYDVPDDRAKAFEASFSDAKREYSTTDGDGNKHTYSVPVGRVSAFEEYMKKNGHTLSDDAGSQSKEESKSSRTGTARPSYNLSEEEKTEARNDADRRRNAMINYVEDKQLDAASWAKDVVDDFHEKGLKREADPITGERFTASAEDVAREQAEDEEQHRRDSILAGAQMKEDAQRRRDAGDMSPELWGDRQEWVDLQEKKEDINKRREALESLHDEAAAQGEAGPRSLAWASFLSLPYNPDPSPDAKQNTLKQDRFGTIYQAAKNELDREEEYAKLNYSKSRGKNRTAFGAFLDTTFDWDTWNAGATDLQTATGMLNTLDDNLTVEEQLARNILYGASLGADEQEQTYREQQTAWEKGGEMTGEMLPFMVDFLVGTHGGSAAMHGGAKVATKGAARIIGKESTERISKRGVRNFIKEEGWKALVKDKDARTYYALKFLGNSVDDIAQSAYMANTIQGTRTAADIMQRHLGTVQEGADGSLFLQGGDSWGRAVWQGEANAIVENYSEMFGTSVLDKLPIGSTLLHLGKNSRLGQRLGETFGAKNMSRLLRQTDARGLQDIYHTTEKAFSKLGVSDMFGEIAEEYVGQVLRTALNLDDAYIYNDDGTRTNGLLSLDWHGDLWSGMGISMGMMNGFKGGFSMVGYARARNKASRASKNAEQTFREGMWKPLRAVIDCSDNDNIGDVTNAIMSDGSLSADERMAALDYITKLSVVRGWNLAAASRSLDDDDVLSASENRAWLDGYNAVNEQEITDAVTTMHENEASLESFGLLEAMQDEDDDKRQASLDALRLAASSPEATEEDKAKYSAAIAYFNAVMYYNGLAARSEHSIANRRASASGYLNARRDRDGNIVTAKDSEGRTVYIRKGKVVRNSDGSINYDKSDKEVTIIGERGADAHRVSLSELSDIAEPISATTAFDMRAEEIEQEARVAYGQAVDPQFNQGDVYEIIDDNGNVQRVHVVSDEQGMVISMGEDGKRYAALTADGRTVFKMSLDDVREGVRKANERRKEEIEAYDKEETPERVHDTIIRMRDGSMARVVKGNISHTSGVINRNGSSTFVVIEDEAGQRHVVHPKDILSVLSDERGVHENGMTTPWDAVQDKAEEATQSSDNTPQSEDTETDPPTNEPRTFKVGDTVAVAIGEDGAIRGTVAMADVAGNHYVVMLDDGSAPIEVGSESLLPVDSAQPTEQVEEQPTEQPEEQSAEQQTEQPTEQVTEQPAEHNVSPRVEKDGQKKDDTRFRDAPLATILGDSYVKASEAKAQVDTMTTAATEAAGKLGLDNVVVLPDGRQFTGRKARAKGWYDFKTGKIYIIAGNHTSEADVLATLMHEAVAHYGLRQLMGEEFDTFLDDVYNNADPYIQYQIDTLAEQKYNGDRRTATEEYMAAMAEGTTFNDSFMRSTWEKIKQLFRDALRKIGLKDTRLDDSDLRYILWRSYSNLRGNAHSSVFAAAEDMVARQAFAGQESRPNTDEPIRFSIGKKKKEDVPDGTYEEKLWESGYFVKDKKVRDLAEEEASRLKESAAEIEAQTTGSYPGGAYDADETDALFRDGDPEMHREALARDSYEHLMRTGTYQAQEALQDSMLSLEESMRLITGKDKGEFYVADIPGWQNAYLGENRLTSETKAECDLAGAILFRPLTKAVERLARNEDERADLIDYMMAKHGLERNVYMAERDAQKAFEEYQNTTPNGKKTLQDFIDEYRKKDYAGLTALTGEQDVADAEDAARDIVAQYESSHDADAVDGLWEKTDAANKAILDKQLECGMISKETYDKIREMYDNYIPLRGFDEAVAEDMYTYLGGKESPFNAPIKTARGRKSKADDPFANMQTMMESAIIQGNRNLLVAQRFLNFALNHPSDLVSVSNLWLQYDDINDEWVAVFPDNIDDNDDATTVAQKMKDFNEKMDQLAANEPDRYKSGRGAKNIPYRVKHKKNLDEHFVIAYVNGESRLMCINGNPRLAQALNGKTNPDNEFSGAAERIASAVMKVNRALSMAYTTLSPDFMLSNFCRDMIYSNIMAHVKNSGRYGRTWAAAFHINCARYNPKTVHSLLKKWRKGKLDANNETQQLFYEFMINGGETGYIAMIDIETHKKNMIREIKRSRQSKAVIRGLTALWENYDDAMRAVELSARVAAYVTSRKMGRSIDQAIWDAKEVGVNFNKKGSGSKFLGAKGQTAMGNLAGLTGGMGRLLFVFWNAGMQGMANFWGAYKRHPVKGTAAILTFFAAGFIQGFVNSIIGGGDGDDDDDKENGGPLYWDLPGHVRRQNIVARVSGNNFLTVPLPIEFRAFYGIGELASTVAFNDRERDTPAGYAKDVASQLTQLLPVDVLEGKGTTSLVPSAFKPLVEAYALNQSWTGYPITNRHEWNEQLPEWTKAYKGTSKVLIGWSKTLNEATGGDDYTKGWIEDGSAGKIGRWINNPAQVEYVLNGYLGGLYSTFERTVKTASGVVEGEFNPRTTPLVNRMWKQTDDRTDKKSVNEEYYRITQDAAEAKRRFDAYKNAAKGGSLEYAEKVDLLYYSPEFRRYLIYHYSPERKGIEILKKRKKLLPDTEKEQIHKIDSTINRLKIDLVDRVHEYEDENKE